MVGLLNLQWKLFWVKHHLKQWNKEVFGNVFDTVKAAENELNIMEWAFDEDQSDSNLMELKRAQAQLAAALAREESFWKQKSACKWLKEGEQNTAYFHSLVKKCRHKYYIYMVENNGEKIIDRSRLGPSAAVFFEKLLTGVNTVKLIIHPLQNVRCIILQFGNGFACSELFLNIFSGVLV
ncbi:hypothetical protein Pfo_018158 [Paulownia fortunei]|nr:hypothetical protein Pfo_018158 [Paulownia fortunei]